MPPNRVKGKEKKSFPESWHNNFHKEGKAKIKMKK